MSLFKKCLLAAICVHSVCSFSIAQTPPIIIGRGDSIAYTIIKHAGDSLIEAGDYEAAIKAYKNDIPSEGSALNKTSSKRYDADLYNLSCAFSRINEQDSAIKYLERYIREFADSTTTILSDIDFLNARNSPKWNMLEDKVIQQYCLKEKVVIVDLSYAKELWAIKVADQAYIQEIDEAKEKTGQCSAIVLALYDLKRRMQKENLLRLQTLIQKKGWPKISQVGKYPAAAAFLVIQHDALEQQKKYLPVILDLCKKGEARWQDYALMHDRIRVSENKPQRYGSQVQYNSQTRKYELLPLEDTSRVDEFRSNVHLPPIKEYLSLWKIDWSPEK